MTKLMVALTLLLASCGPVRNMMDPDAQAEYNRMLLEEVELEAQLEDAVPADAPAIQEELDALQVEIARLEGVAVRNTYGPVWGTLTALPVVGPYLAFLGPFAGTFALPLFSKRGRKHYWSMVRNVTPGVAGAGGGRGVDPIAAVLDLARAFGMAHSSDASKAAATAS